ncbi:unnamed protein product [Tuber melanosporum]|uniref:(Perigord truffle) hypothetical protein n=1 Tax=Tuber melanosporum (strain Mel28) TaxID=656061 RepID=D5GIG6_TUBMM|nr:uncharacterized protein GSTUM_00008491001 [Tuber melanosporum]CAZ84309.1 unnamed protein product [Tuber melanosporum]
MANRDPNFWQLFPSTPNVRTNGRKRNHQLQLASFESLASIYCNVYPLQYSAHHYQVASMDGGEPSTWRCFVVLHGVVPIMFWEIGQSMFCWQGRGVWFGGSITRKPKQLVFCL